MVQIVSPQTFESTGVTTGRLLKDYAASHCRPAHGRPHPVVSFAWRDVYTLLGLDGAAESRDMDRQWPVVQAALDELHAAGVLAHHDCGPGTFGHTETMYCG